MTTYKKETLCDSVQRWVEGKSDHGILQELKERHNTSSYDALLCSNIFLTRTTTENQATVKR